MLETFKYINHLNEVIEFGKNGIYVNYNTLRDYNWDITSANNKIASFKKGIVSKAIPVIIKCHSEEEGIEIRNRLFEVFEKDVLAKKNGRIVIGEYYLKCYITGSKKTKYLLNDGYMHLSLTMKSDYPAWIKESYTIFRPKSALNTSESAEGRGILIGNATNSILTGYGVYGKSEQKSYTGKNLVECVIETATYNGITITKNSDGTYAVNGTSTKSNSISVGSDWYIPMPDWLIPGESYIISGSGLAEFRIYFYKEDKTTASSYYQNWQFTVPNDAVYYGIYISHILDTVYTNDIIYPMIRKASITDSTYEPYVGGEASPNPSYPQEIVSVADDGDLVVKSNNKNLLENKATTQTRNGITFTVNSDKSISVKGTATANTYYYVSDIYYKLPIGNYILSSGGNASNDCQLIHYFYKPDNTYLGNVVDLGKPTNFNVEGNISHRDNIYVPSGATVDATIYPMIRLASIEDDSYEPYNSTQATIPLTDSLRGIKVSEGGNYTDESGQMWVCDTIEKYADGSGKLVQRVYHKVFDGTESFSANTIGDGYRFDYSDSNVKSNSGNGNVKEALCNKLVVTFPNYMYRENDNCFAITLNNTMWFRFATLANITDVTTLQAQLKTWYDNGEPMEFICELADYIETPLTAEQIAEIEKLQTYEGVTYITNDDDAYQTAIYSIKQYLDFPYGYEYDFTADFDSDELLNTSFVPVDFRMVIHGAVTNPSLFISGHEYNVDVTIKEGDYLTIDSQAKTIVLSKQDGTQVNCFNKRNRDSYVFEKIPSGKNEITSTGDLNIDITLLDERSEPRWI